jgi:hypothetical protein
MSNIQNLQFVADLFQRGKKFSATNFGRNIVGHLAQPVLVNLQEVEHKKLLEDEIEDLKDPPGIFEQIKEGFINNFSRGDLLSLIGVALLAIQSKLLPSRSKNPGMIESGFRALAMGLTFGGSVSALLGRSSEMHLKVALGDRYADAKLKAAEKKGKKIFSEYSNEQIEKLILKSKTLDKLLVYPKGLKEMILERHAKEDIGGIFDGPPGTGKTQGVELILGKWSERLKSEGYTPVIAELNLVNFDEYLKESSRSKAEFLEAAQIMLGVEAGAPGTITSGEGLLILELLIKKIQKLVNQVNKHNQNSHQKQKLAIFVDEFDKIFDPKTLAGCDKQRLKSLLLQFNELFVKTNILLTSNTFLEDMIKEIKKHLKTDQSDAEEVWKPMYSRLSSKNRSYVDRPARAQQAEIISARLLDTYRPFLDWKNLGLPYNGTSNQELDRKQLAEAIKNIIEELNLDLDGRELAYACDDMRSMLLGRARELRVESANKIPDEIWDKLSINEKILKAGALIDQDLIKNTLKTKASSNRLETYDNDRNLVMNILSSYFSNPKLKDQLSSFDNEKGVNEVSLLSLMASAFDVTNSGKEKIYSSKHLVDFDGAKQGFFISRRDAGLHSSGSEPLFKFTIAKKSNSNQLEKKVTRDFSLTEILSITNEIMEQVSGKKSKAIGDVFKVINTFVQQPNNLLATQDALNTLEGAIKNLAV